MNSMTTMFKALSDGNRLRVVAALLEYDELCACQLTELLGISGATVSRHMGILLNAELVTSRKEGRWIFYSLGAGAKLAAPVIAWLKEQARQSAELQVDLEMLKSIVGHSREDLCRKQRGTVCCPK